MLAKTSMPFRETFKVVTRYEARASLMPRRTSLPRESVDMAPPYEDSAGTIRECNSHKLLR